MIYYPLSVLMLAGIKDILIISTPRDIPFFQNLLGDGEWLGMYFEYAIQESPKGLAEAFIIGKDFIGDDNVALVLGDNVFYGQSFTNTLTAAVSHVEASGGAMIFGYYVKEPSAYGVVEFDENHKVLNIEEKPKNPKSNYAVPGLYFYDNTVIEKALNVKPSSRGELEITSVNNAYLVEERLKVQLLGRGMAWLDTGSPKGMLKASQFVRTVQEMQGFYISCIEEIAWRRGYITTEQLLSLGNELKMTEYGQYLISIATSDINPKE
jgi:glucose-1-phosphate thymidylyltransferase